MASRKLRILAGSILVLAGAAALAASLAGYVRGTVWQHRHAVGDDPILELKGNHPPSLTPGAPFARLSIPRIGLDVIVVEGTRKEDLLKGPGHLVGSADPGAGDNCVIAAHRDLHFRGLDRLVPGDLIRLNSGGKNSEYRVETSRVVSPDDNSVLASSHEALLTLITCYPFRFVGPAPKRYVVRARLAGDSGATL